MSVLNVGAGAPGGGSEPWARALAGGDWAVGLFNRGESSTTVIVNWSDLKLTGKHKVQDLWAHQDWGMVEDRFAAGVPAHGVVLVRVGR